MKIGLILLGFLMVGCSSSHKLTGTDFIDLETGQAASPQPADYPSEVVDSLGWPNIRTELFEKDDHEEFRFWFHSEVYPAHLFRFTKKGKSTKGEVVLYWPLSQPGYEGPGPGYHQRMKLYLRGSCKKVNELQNYAYCIPDYTKDKYGDDVEPDWEQLYARVESQDIWQLPDQSAIERSGEAKGDWEVFVQLRLGNYYRSYMHSNPTTYREYNLRSNVQSISNVLSSVKESFSRREWLNTYHGITEGTLFTLCDSSETWQFWGNLQSLVSKQGFTIDVKQEGKDKETYFYVVIKGQIEDLWHDRRLRRERDRRVLVVEVGSILPVQDGKCPNLAYSLLNRRE